MSEYISKRVVECSSEDIGKSIQFSGWVRTVRMQKGQSSLAFIELNDGSCLKNIQLIYEGNVSFLTGTSLLAKGVLVKSPSPQQPYELRVESLEILGHSDSTYPLQKKAHSLEFLRQIAHLRPRTNTFGAIARIRSRLAFEIHRFFQENGFLYVQTPVITSSDCEGAGQLFRLVTDEKEPFFGKDAFLTCSGQLNGEAFATALGKIYTFGPTFRAEHSNTSRHLAEFWMVEPEMAFCDLSQNKEVAEALIRHLIHSIFSSSIDDLTFLESRYEKGLIERLQVVLETPFTHLTYTDAISLLKKSNFPFVYPVEWGIDLQSEHERYLAEQVFKGPVILSDYPKALKPFYMKSNSDGKTVACMDILVPKIGEIIGGSQREDSYSILESNLQDHQLPLEDYSWYLDLRKYGSVPHSGFGLGFERLVQFITGTENIRDAIAFPRAHGLCSF